jgi:hypothetical protein
VTLDPTDWLAPFPAIAAAELALERGDAGAEERLKAVEPRIAPQLIEERVQIMQELGYLRIVAVDLLGAYPLLDNARRVARGAGAWSEVAQMNLAVAGFDLVLRRHREADELLAEAAAISEEHPGLAIEPLIHATRARSQASQGEIEAALAAVVQAAAVHARQGDALGYVGMVSYAVSIQLEARRFAEAYQTILVGQGIARHLKLGFAEKIFRGQVDLVRQKLGPVQFDALVRELLAREKGQGP